MPRRDLLRQVQRITELADEFELGLQPIGVVFLASQHRLEEIAAPAVVFGHTEVDTRVEAGDRLGLEIEGQAQLLGDRLTDQDRPSRCMFGTPSRYKMRSINSSASFISPIDSSRNLLARCS